MPLDTWIRVHIGGLSDEVKSVVCDLLDHEGGNLHRYHLDYYVSELFPSWDDYPHSWRDSDGRADIVTTMCDSQKHAFRVRKELRVQAGYHPLPEGSSFHPRSVLEQRIQFEYGEEAKPARWVG